MPGWIWSDPDPSKATPAALGAGFQLHADNIGPLVHSILQYRLGQQEQQARQASQIAGALSQQGRSDQSDDAANAAIYSASSPGAYQDYLANGDANVPDYGGASAYAALQHARQLNPTQFQDPLTKRYNEARASSEEALANQRWSGDTGDPLLDYRRQQLIDESNQSQWNAKMAQSLGIDKKDLPAAIYGLTSYKPGVTPFPTFGPYTKWDDSNPTQSAQKDQLLANFRSMMAQRPTQMAVAPGSLSTTPAPSLPDGTAIPAAGVPGATTSSTTSTRPGAGPPDAAIQMLVSHPELAQQFDAKYGSGMAAQYLTQ